MRKINPDGTLEGFEFRKGYDPYAEDTPAFVRISNQDLIDFPCSPDWVRHYAHQGMTQDYPPDFYFDKKGPLQPTEVTIKDPYMYNNNIYIRGAEFRQLKGFVLFLQSKLNEHLDKTKRKSKSKPWRDG